MLFPELEEGLLSPKYQQRLQFLEASSTDIDLLEIAHGQSVAVNWQQGLNHEKLLTWFKVNGSCEMQPAFCCTNAAIADIHSFKAH